MKNVSQRGSYISLLCTQCFHSFHNSEEYHKDQKRSGSRSLLHYDHSICLAGSSTQVARWTSRERKRIGNS